MENTFLLMGEITSATKNVRLLDIEGIMEVSTEDYSTPVKVYLEEGLLNKLEESLVFEKLPGTFCAIKGKLKPNEDLVKPIVSKFVILSKEDLKKVNKEE